MEWDSEEIDNPDGFARKAAKILDFPGNFRQRIIPVNAEVFLPLFNRKGK